MRDTRWEKEHDLRAEVERAIATAEIHNAAGERLKAALAGLERACLSGRVEELDAAKQAVRKAADEYVETFVPAARNPRG